MVCTTNLAQDNPGIAQIHALRVTYIFRGSEELKSATLLSLYGCCWTSKVLGLAIYEFSGVFALCMRYMYMYIPIYIYTAVNCVSGRSYMYAYILVLCVAS